MNVGKEDLKQVQNLLRALQKAKFTDVEGLEVLALADMFKWAASLHDKIKQDCDQAEILAKAKILEQQENAGEAKKTPPKRKPRKKRTEK